MKDKTSSSDDKEGNVEAAINQSIRNVDYGDLLWVRLHGSSWWPAQVVDGSAVSAINQPRKRRREGEVLVRLYGSYKYLFINPISTLSEFKNMLEKYSGNYNAILEESLKQDLHQLKFATTKKKEIKTKGKVVADASQERIAKKKTKKLPSSPGTSSGKTSVGATPKTSLKRARSSTHNSEQGSAKQGHSSPGKMGSLRTKVQTPNTAQRNLRKKDAAGTKKNTTSEEPAKEPSARKVKVMQFLGLASPTGSPFIPNGSISNSA